VRAENLIRIDQVRESPNPALHESASGPKQTEANAPHMSAFGGKAGMRFCIADVRFFPKLTLTLESQTYQLRNGGYAAAIIILR
jgi:hypothetical protein